MQQESVRLKVQKPLLTRQVKQAATSLNNQCIVTTILGVMYRLLLSLHLLLYAGTIC